MIIIPAIDLSQGKCVRLFQGRKDKETVYSSDPVQVARLWEEKGASRLHLVDLDGAFEGKPHNGDIIKKIASAIEIPVQLGGGLRDVETVKNAFELGVEKVILGTVCVENPRLLEELAYIYNSRIIVGIDARDGKVAVKGWVEETTMKARDLAAATIKLGLKEIIYTDISRDGALVGPNYKALEEMASLPGIEVIASGGISSLDDLKKLSLMKNDGIKGVIVGKALYDGLFSLEDALIVAGKKG